MKAGLHQNCACRKVLLSDEQEKYLKKIGLSRDAIALYNTLLAVGPLTAQGAATHNFNFPSAQYRLFYELESHGLVQRHAGRPRSFSVVPLELGLQSSLLRNKQELQELLKTSLSRLDSTENTRIIIGRQTVYDAYAKYAETATKEIVIYSIGIAFSKKLETTQRSALKRGVRIRHIMQRYKPANYFVVHKWLRAGVKMRHLPGEHGFHFFVIDSSWVCITFSDPTDTENRLSILTNNTAAAQMFIRQFDDFWTQAKQLIV